MRDDDFDRRRAGRQAEVDVAVDRPRVPGRETLVQTGSRAALDGPGVPGKRTLTQELVPAQGAHGDRDPVTEVEFHVAKARELMTALRATPSRTQERVLRADLRCHLDDAERNVARCSGHPRGQEAITSVMQLMIEVAAAGREGNAENNDAAAIAQRGFDGAGQQLPFRDEIQRSFGHHDVSQVRAHIGGAAADASRELGAHAYAHGDHVAFATDPTLFVAAHEAAHVVQQRSGVSLKAIDGGADDSHERHADDVASAVVRGESAVPLLAQLPSGGGSGAHAVQRKGEGGPTGAAAAPAPKVNGKELYLSRNAQQLWLAVGDYLQRINFPVPDARLQWRDERLFTDRLVQTLRGAIDLSNRSQLLAVLYPAEPYGALDGLVPLNATGAPLNMTWSPAVGHAIAPLFVDAVTASLQRLGPRWVSAAEHSPERAGTLDENKSLVSFDALIKSAPIDISVARALTSGAVVELTGNGKPKSEKPRPLRTVTLLWQGPKLWNWVKAIEPSDASPEEVAATLWSKAGSEKTGPASFYAYGITATPPLFGIPPTWAIQFDDAKRHAPEKVTEGSQEQRLLEIASSDKADDLAVAQAAQQPGTKKHATVQQLLSTLNDCATQLNFVIATLARFKLDVPVANALRWVLVRQGELASATPEDAAKWEPAIVQQKKHLATIVPGVQQIAASGNPDAEPIKRVLSTYAHAAGVSFMPTSCEQLIASALAQQGALALQSVRGTATDLQESVAQFEGSTGHSLDPKRFTNPEDLAARCNEMQSQMLAGKQVDGAALEATLLQAQEVTLYAKIDGLRAQLKQLRAQAAAIADGSLSIIIAQIHGSFRSVPDAADAFEADLAAVEQVWHADTRFASITTSGPDRDENMRATRRLLLDAAQQRFTQIAGNGNTKIAAFLRDAASALQSQERYIQIAATCIEMLAMLGISFVASAAGGMVSRFIGGFLVRGGGAELAEMSLGARTLAAAGRVAAAGAGLATEAGVNVAGQHALGQKDEDAGLGTEMLENMLMIGGANMVLGRIGKDLEFAQTLEKQAGARWTNAAKTVVGNTATITTHAVLNIALSYVARQVTTAAGLRKESERAVAANTAQLNEWFMQGISIALGRFVHSRFAPRMETYKKLAQLPNLPRARLLPAKAESLLRLGSTSETQPSSEAALQLMGKPKEVLLDEEAVLEELAKSPAARQAAGMSVGELAALQHRNAADRADVHIPGSESVPLIAAGLEDLGGGKLWTGTPGQIRTALDNARTAHLTAQEVVANGIHKITIEGETFEVHERADTATAKSTAPEHGAQAGAHEHPDTAKKSPAEHPSETNEDSKAPDRTVRSEISATKRHGVPRDVPVNAGEPRHAVASTKEVSRDRIPDHLRELAAKGAVMSDGGRDEAGRRRYEVTLPDGRREVVIEAEPDATRPGAGRVAPQEHEAASNRVAADRAAEIQASRDADLAAVIEKRGTKPIIVDTGIAGAGQAGTLAAASHPDASPAIPGVKVTEIPDVINFAPEGSMFANHGDFPIGQGHDDLRGPEHIRNAGEFSSDRSGYTRASDYVRSLTMTAYDAGMVTYRAKVEEVDVRPPGGWGPDVDPTVANLPLRWTAGGHTFYGKRFITAGGLGRPTSLGRSGTSLSAHEPKLREARKLVDAQTTLVLPDGSAGKVVVVVGSGPTGAWACEAAIRAGASKIVWAGIMGPPIEDAALRAELAAFGLDAAQIDTFARAYNKRNTGVFKLIEEGRIELRAQTIADAVLIESTGRVAVTFPGSQVPLEVDGIVAAAGQVLDLPKGIDPAHVVFRMKKVNGRLLGLDAFDPKDNRRLGIRMVGAQMAKAEPLVAQDEQKEFKRLLNEQANAPSVPSDARGVIGSIYQTNIDVPLVSREAPLEPGEIK